MVMAVETTKLGGRGGSGGTGGGGSAATLGDAVPNYDLQVTDGAPDKVKIICLGDSAVGKSKLVERFLMDGYQPQQLSTYALTLFKYETKLNGKEVHVDFWDTAGQERFSSMHPSYYHQAHACILVFDVTRKVTYKNLPNWYRELREYRPEIPCLCVANKIDVDYSVTKRNFNFASKNGLPLYFVSASDGSNVVKVFRDAIKVAVSYKNTTTDITDLIMKELENIQLSADVPAGAADTVESSTRSNGNNGKSADKSKTDDSSSW